MENNHRIREPKLFVGSAKRIPVHNSASKSFSTLDQITVHRRDFISFGSPMPVAAVHLVLTLWHLQDGLPLKTINIDDKLSKKYWIARQNGPPSFLYALPESDSLTSCKFVVLPDEREVGYADFTSKVTRFDKFIPPSYLKMDYDIPEEELFTTTRAVVVPSRSPYKRD